MKKRIITAVALLLLLLLIMPVCTFAGTAAPPATQQEAINLANSELGFEYFMYLANRFIGLSLKYYLE